MPTNAKLAEPVKIIRAVIYARVSSDEQAKESHYEKRPEGAKAFAMLQSGEADALIVYRMDRLGRPIRDGDEGDIPPLIRTLAKSHIGSIFPYKFTDVDLHKPYEG
jgi:DNA invertase Pin-like site-specific DNA recombinase